MEPGSQSHREDAGINYLQSVRANQRPREAGLPLLETEPSGEKGSVFLKEKQTSPPSSQPWKRHRSGPRQISSRGEGGVPLPPRCLLPLPRLDPEFVFRDPWEDCRKPQSVSPWAREGSANCCSLSFLWECRMGSPFWKQPQRLAQCPAHRSP